MLDAYIIDKIRREREPREGDRLPLHIENPFDGPYDQDSRRERPERREDDEPVRGVVIIDFTI